MSEKEINEQTEKYKTDFKKIIVEFCKDLLTTFPELQDNLDDDLIHILQNTDNDEVLTRVYDYCKSVFPERFFDILYQNKEIFTNDELNTKFLPNVEFKELWKCEITDATRETIWKYLQLILFSIVSNISDGESFGNTAKLFEAINEDEFKSKLEETINNMKDMFEDNNVNLKEIQEPKTINLIPIFEYISFNNIELYDFSNIDVSDLDTTKNEDLERFVLTHVYYITQPTKAT